MEIESIGAIQDCMDDLGFHRGKSRTFEAHAKITNLLFKRKFGGIKIVFNSNWHSGDGPYIEMDDVIKGYNIPYTCFKPKWQNFTYDTNSRTLTVSGEGYKFALEFEGHVSQPAEG